MTEREYKTVRIDYPKVAWWRWWRRPPPELAPRLNREAEGGWRLVQILHPADFGYTTTFVAVFERERR